MDAPLLTTTSRRSPPFTLSFVFAEVPAMKVKKMMKFKLSSLTTDPECARPDLQETMLLVLSSHLLSDVLATKELWLVWDRRMLTLETKHSPSVESSPSSTQLSMVSLLTGTIWKRSGTIPSTTSFVLLLRNTLHSSPRLLSTLRQTVRRWSRSCSKPSTLPLPTSLSRLSFPCTHPDVPLVSFSTPETEFPTPSLSTRDMHFLTLSCVWILLDAISLST
mmetsp:Transcript_31272/g.52915  ORF Transcript_31272/g.52915 Transcript_31272/m.52915 type:complete len:220 (-) Transcript_31272:646-1305(-)